MTVDDVIDVVAMRHLLVTATRTMNMAGLMGTTRMLGGAFHGIRGVYVQRVLVNVVSVRMVQVTVMQVIHVVTMRNRGVTAIRPVDVGMVAVRLAI